VLQHFEREHLSKSRPQTQRVRVDHLVHVRTGAHIDARVVIEQMATDPFTSSEPISSVERGGAVAFEKEE